MPVDVVITKKPKPKYENVTEVAVLAIIANVSFVSNFGEFTIVVSEVADRSFEIVRRDFETVTVIYVLLQFLFKIYITGMIAAAKGL